MRKSQRWPKIRSPPFIHWLNSNHGRIVILPPEDHELVVSHGGMFSLGSSIICWAGSLTWTKSLEMCKLEEQNCQTILTILGFVSREFFMIKEFILISLAIEYCALTIYCSVALLMFGLRPSIAALINRIT